MRTVLKRFPLNELYKIGDNLLHTSIFSTTTLVVTFNIQIFIILICIYA